MVVHLIRHKRGTGRVEHDWFLWVCLTDADTKGVSKGATLTCGVRVPLTRPSWVKAKNASYWVDLPRVVEEWNDRRDVGVRLQK